MRRLSFRFSVCFRGRSLGIGGGRDRKRSPGEGGVRKKKEASVGVLKQDFRRPRMYYSPEDVQNPNTVSSYANTILFFLH